MQLTDKIRKVLYSHSHKIQDDIIKDNSDSNHWHMTRFIRKNFIPEKYIFFQKIDEKKFYVLYDNFKVAILNNDFFSNFNIINPYVNNKKVILSDREMFFYYIQKILKNYLFFIYLIEKDEKYIKYINILNSEQNFFSEIVADLNNPLNINVNISPSNSTIKLKNNYIKELNLNIKSGDEFFEFSIEQEKTYKNFNNFLSFFNKYLYDKIIYKTTKIPVENFKKEHLHLIRILTV